MKVIIDTCIWSEAFRKPIALRSKDVVFELQELIKEGRVVMIGAVRQELLSGIKLDKDYDKLKESMRAFEDYIIKTEDYEYASKLFNRCRRKGIQGANVDFLICSVAERNGVSIFTTDNDFKLFSEHIKIDLHNTRAHGR